MKIFVCDNCGNLLFFENVQCVRCEKRLGFLPDVTELCALEPIGENVCRPLSAAAKAQAYRFCANGLQHQACNWLIEANDPLPFCQSCRLNRTIPDLSLPENCRRWRRIEAAKRRLVYSLNRLGLSTEGNPSENRPPLRFDLLADAPNGTKVMTGHSQGLITLNIAEADDVIREQRRVSLHEPYRTLVGHF